MSAASTRLHALTAALAAEKAARAALVAAMQSEIAEQVGHANLLDALVLCYGSAAKDRWCCVMAVGGCGCCCFVVAVHGGGLLLLLLPLLLLLLSAHHQSLSAHHCWPVSHHDGCALLLLVLVVAQVSSIQALQQRIEAAQGQQLQLEGRMGQLTEEMSRAVAGLAGLGALLQPAAGQVRGLGGAVCWSGISMLRLLLRGMPWLSISVEMPVILYTTAAEETGGWRWSESPT